MNQVAFTESVSGNSAGLKADTTEVMVVGLPAAALGVGRLILPP